MELPDDVAGRAPGDPGHISNTLQVWAMTDCARYRGAWHDLAGHDGRATRRRKHLTSRHASDRNIGHEPRARVPEHFGLLRILGHLNHSLSERLRPSSLLGDEESRCGGMEFWDSIGLDDLDPWRPLDGPKILSGGPSLGGGQGLRDRDHLMRVVLSRLGALTRAARKRGHRLHEVIDRQPRNASVLHLAFTVVVVAQGTRADPVFLAAAGDDLWHRRMIFGKRVRWTVPKADLPQRESRAATGNTPEHAVIGNGRNRPVAADRCRISARGCGLTRCSGLQEAISPVRRLLLGG